MTPETLYQPLNSIRTEYRLRMNRSADLAAKFAAEDDMQSVSEHSTESERCREAFQAMNRAIFAVDEYYAALSAQQRERVVRVKELEWRQSSGGDDPVVKGAWWADTTLGRYIARENTADGSGWFLFRQPVWNKTESLDAAKSAAQADYEQRIMAAIEIQSSDGGHGGQPSALTDAVRGASAPNAISGKQEGQTGIEVGASQTPGSSMLSGQSAPIVPEKALGPSEAIADVAAERRRQIEVEGWTPEHDDEHERAEMACAAACYALSGTPADEAIYIHGRWKDIRDLFWPWSRDWWKPKDRRRNLVKAGALIVAEIERLDRLASGRR